MNAMMTERKKRILVVAAHPDDEVLGCGGTIKRLSEEGHEIYLAILGEGITSRYSAREEADAAQLETLHQNAHRAAALLGAQDLSLFALPDNQFDTVPLLSVIHLVEELVQRYQPQVIYTHHGGDLNLDHVVLHRAVLTATRPLAGTPVQDLYAFEVASSTEWAFQQFDPAFRPNVFVDITGTLDTKIQAMQCYESESRAAPHPRAPASLEAIAHRWGSVVGCAAAEAFQLIRSVR